MTNNHNKQFSDIMLYTHDPQMFYGLKKWKLQYASATRTVQN